MMTDEEITRRHIDIFGESLGSYFDLLWRELVWLHIKWIEFVELYGADPGRIDLLNRVAPNFFRIVQQVLCDDILLHLSRICDSPQSSRKQNLTIRVLPELVDEKSREAVRSKVKAAEKATEFCRDHRNRRIAHSDLPLAVNRTDARTLEAATRQKIREALDAIGGVLNCVYEAYGLGPTGFEHTIPALGGAALLIDKLKRLPGL